MTGLPRSEFFIFFSFFRLPNNFVALKSALFIEKYFTTNHNPSEGEQHSPPETTKTSPGFSFIIPLKDTNAAA
jgi:hypothetical protein